MNTPDLDADLRPDQLTGLDDAALQERQSRHAWNYLLSQWDEAYEFEHRPGRGKPYTATRRDNGLLLTARSAESLLSLVRQDYDRAPVPREVAP